MGCEWVDSVCAQFFTENNIPFTRSQLEGVEGSLYQVSNFDFSLKVDLIDQKTDLSFRNNYELKGSPNFDML